LRRGLLRHLLYHLSHLNYLPIKRVTRLFPRRRGVSPGLRKTVFWLLGSLFAQYLQLREITRRKYSKRAFCKAFRVFLRVEQRSKTTQQNASQQKNLRLAQKNRLRSLVIRRASA